MMKRIACSLALALIAGGAGTASGQSAEAWLRGRVVAAGGGAAVSGAEVRLEGAVLRDASTGEDGTFAVGPAPVGRYTLRVEHVGYAPADVEVDVGGGADDVQVLLTPRPVSLDALVVTAARRLQRLADAPVATELVSRREILETGATDLGSVLTERTGVELQGGHPAGSGLMIQGLGSERVLVLLDGQPFIGRIAGTIDVSRIPTSMIERIEVVKGPQSTVYGSEAMGGVVNVITRSPATAAWTASGSVTAGDQGRLDVAGQALGGVGDVTGVADIGRRTIELAPGVAGESGALATRWDGRGRVAWRTPLPGLTLEAAGLLLDERQRWRGGQLYQFADNTQWTGRIGAVWERGAHSVTPTVFATSFDHLSRGGPSPVPAEGSGERERQRLVEGELLYSLALGEHAVDAGFEVRHETIRSDRVANARRVSDRAESFAQATFSWGAFTLVPGVRATSSEPWGSHWTPRIAALYRPLPELGLRLAIGEGFRAPDFKELHMEFLNIGPGFAYTVRGNPDLFPEQSRNVTASVEWAGAQTYLRIQGFENRFDNFIETRPAGDSSGVQVFTYGNVDDGFTRGAELEAGVTWGGLRAEASYAVLRAERAATGEPLLGRPEMSGRAVLGYVRPSGLRLSLTGVYTGRTPMQHTENGTDWRAGFLRFDARLARRVWGGFEVAAGVDNLLDRRPDAWPGFAGRHVYTTLSWRPAADAR